MALAQRHLDEPGGVEAVISLVDRIAEAWLAAGSGPVTLERDGIPIQSWPASIQVSAPQNGNIRAIVSEGPPEIAVTVEDPQQPAPKEQIEVEAKLLHLALQGIADIDALSNTLVETQDQLVALFDLTISPSDPGDLEAVMVASTREANTHLGSSWACLTMRGPEGDLIISTPGAPSGPDHGELEHLVSNRQDHAYERSAAEQSAPTGVTTNALIRRLSLDDDHKGLLIVADKALGFDSADRKLLRTIGGAVSAALESAIRHRQALEQAKLDREFELAALIQSRILPTTMPEMAGLEVAGMCMPATAVGGDFYDATSSTSRKLIIAVGDVSGHGVGPAMLSALVFNSVHTQAVQPGTISVGQLLTNVNDDVFGPLEDTETLCTLIVAESDPHARTLSVANAGHSPVILKQAGNPARLLTAEHPPLGIFSEIHPLHTELDFPPGSTLIVATDGFPEALNPDGEMFGYERLIELIDNYSQTSAQEIVEAVSSAATHWEAGTSRCDDQTIVAVMATEGNADDAVGTD